VDGGDWRKGEGRGRTWEDDGRSGGGKGRGTGGDCGTRTWRREEQEHVAVVPAPVPGVMPSGSAMPWS